eukprot:scaffold4510_cov183-Amphora_coffeaeformis.AAC.13
MTPHVQCKAPPKRNWLDADTPHPEFDSLSSGFLILSLDALAADTSRRGPGLTKTTRFVLQTPHTIIFNITKNSSIAMAKGRQSLNSLVSVTEPTEMDILCSKDKSVAKHPGNLVFRERIEQGTADYSTAVSKQEKMKITRDIVTFMQQNYGSRFLKQKGDAWVEINNQMARDKVSHALRFAAKNANGGANNSTTTNNKKKSKMTRQRSMSSQSLESSHSSQSSVVSEEQLVPIKTADVGAAPLPSIFTRQQNILANMQKTNNSGSSEWDGIIDFNQFQTMSLGGLLHLPQPEFNTLRSEDLDELMREPMFASNEEWEVVEQMAEC